ncbi:hypothetical protein CCACVL1_07174 [Corchorus capsularis]|uniref:F-box domain-containing protein n=1 Tax=Corchorus capsularis TaxID=210143 RepID=A0A1R3J8W5_COCAP|nr:hypothetical protein CCACVL1_07174 [Corchorus capsularis]
MASSLSMLQDTVSDILSRLPVKSLTRFKSVSKKWADLTSTPAFISSHLRRASPDPCLLVRSYHTQTGNQSALWLYPEPTRHQGCFLLDVPSEEPLLRFPKIVASVDGLVCLDVSPCYASDFIFWNPATRQFKRLPFPLIASSKSNPIWIVFIGFGFDSFSSDYKLVRIVSLKTIDPFPSIRVEVFSWKQWAWKEIEESFDLTVLCGAAEGVAAGGTLNWLAMGLQELANQKFIVSFDMGTEVFKRIALPPITQYGNVKIMSYMGSWAIAVYPLPNGPGINCFEFWVLGEGNDGSKNWTKMVFMDNFINVLVPVTTWRDTELVFKRMGAKDGNSYQSFVLFDPVGEVSKRLTPDGVDMCLEPWSYEESLVSVYGKS